MDNAQTYRAKAAELAVRAERSPYPGIARQYRQLAREYERLANWAERLPARPPLRPVGKSPE